MQHFVETSIFYRQVIASLFQVQEKLKAYGNSICFSSSCFIAGDVYIKMIFSQIQRKRDLVFFMNL